MTLLISSRADYSEKDFRFSRSRTDSDRTQWVETRPIEPWWKGIATLLLMIFMGTVVLLAFSAFQPDLKRAAEEMGLEGER